jgi:hypothetical protein
MLLACTFAIGIVLSLGNLCLQTPQQRGVFPSASYATLTPNNTFCRYDLGAIGAAWVNGGEVGGPCGVPEGAPTYEPGPIVGTYHEEVPAPISFQINSAFPQCASSRIEISVSKVENPRNVRPRRSFSRLLFLMFRRNPILPLCK